MEAADGTQERLGQGLLLAGLQSAADPPPEDPALQSRRGGSVDQFALHEPPRLRDPPVIDRQPVAGPQAEAQEVEPAGFMHRALAPSLLVFDQCLPDAAAERGRPGVAVHARHGGKPLDQALRLLCAVGAEDLLDRCETFLPYGLIDESLGFGGRLVGGNIGLGGGADVRTAIASFAFPRPRCTRGPRCRSP